MKRSSVRAWSELAVTCVSLAGDPTKVAQDLDIPESERASDLPPTLVASAPNSEPAVAPTHRAVNGYLRVMHISGSITEHYVGHQPEFIAEQLRNAKRSGEPMYVYWDRPGYPNAKPVRIATPTVASVDVRFLEADFSALDEDAALWVR